MAGCSICKKMIEVIIYRFEQCSIHIFCRGCFFIKKSFEGFDCLDCSNLLKLKFESKNYQACFYCSGAWKGSQCDNSHKICLNCMQNKEIKIECYDCYIKILSFCSSCRLHKQKKVPDPTNPSKTICFECLNKKYLNITENQIQPKQNSCYLCKQNRLNIQLCTYHRFCIQCSIILQMIKNTEFLRLFIKCESCINLVKNIDLSSACSYCGNFENELIPIFACKNRHNSCRNCLKSSVDPKSLACRDCRIYLLHKRANFKNVCSICYYYSSRTSLKTCNIHYICNMCSERLASIPASIQQYMIECQDCSQSLILSNRNANPNRFIINTTARKNGYCQLCSKNRAFDCLCPIHEFCEDCFKLEKGALKSFIGSCTTCEEIIDKFCNICFKKPKKLLPFKCSSNHIYCTVCFQNEDFIKRENKCNECKQNFKKYKDEQRSCCVKCQRSFDCKSVVCKDHFICKECLLVHDANIIKTKLECNTCMNYSKFSCFRCSKKLNYKKIISLIDCPDHHIYCETCFSDFQNTKNCIAKCNSCKVLFQKNKKNIFKVKKYCSKCNSVELVPMLCREHNFCSKCYLGTNLETHRRCKDCLDILRKICINCISVLSHSEQQGPNLKLEFSFCKKCKKPASPSKSVKNESFTPGKGKKTEICFLCNKKPPIKNLCSDHKVCFDCMQNLDSENGKSYAVLLECSECQLVWKKQFQAKGIPKNKSEEDKINCKLEVVNKNWNLNQLPSYQGSPGPVNTFNETNPETAHSYYQINSELFPPHNQTPQNPIFYQGNFNTVDNDIQNYTGGTNLHHLVTPNFQQVFQKKQEVKCKRCNTRHPRLKCNHAKCPECLNTGFQEKFKRFVEALYTANTSALSNQDFSISCPEPQCNNKYCFPFDLFSNFAYVIVAPYFSDNHEVIQKFLIHYEGFFEGISFSFKNCNYCQNFVGKSQGQVCFCGNR